MTNPNEPTLTCSEVVERLRDECLPWGDGAMLDMHKAEAILHSWRERRVQELEEAIREFRKLTDHWDGKVRPCMHAHHGAANPCCIVASMKVVLGATENALLSDEVARADQEGREA